MRYTPISAVTATTSGVINVSNTVDLSFQFLATGIATGNGVLTLLGSNDGINFKAISFIDPTPANTNAQNIIRLTSLTLSSAGTSSAVGSLDATSNFEFLKFTVTVTTDGVYSVFVFGDAVAKT